jgi:predicted metal-dependent phosphoesterase TrpH
VRNRVYLDGSKPCYKGNLHMHSLWSDGQRTAADMVERYRSRGYAFVCLSDHEVYTDTEEFDTDGFITIPGMERGGLNPVEDKNPGYHFGVLGDPDAAPTRPRYAHLQRLTRLVPWTGDSSPQDLIDELSSRGNLVIFNHPEWHLTRFEDMVKCHGFFAVEIYNYATEWTPSTSYGTAYWDHALQNGKRVFCVAADDSHSQKDDAIRDYDGGWVQVQADSLSRRDIIRALKRGGFYSSSGPSIHDLRVEDGRLRVQCSPCRFIMFKAFPQRGEFIADFKNGTLLTSASNAIAEDMDYIRVECIDAEGQVAWSNPVFVDDLLGK